MYTQAPRLTRQLRLGLFVFIVTSHFDLPAVPHPHGADPQNPPVKSQQDVRTWELPDSAILRLGKGVLGGSDRAVAFSRDGKHLAVASGIGIWIYDVATADELALLNVERTMLIRSVAYSPDGMILAAGTGYGAVQLWDVETGQRIDSLFRPGPAYGVDALAFSPTGKILAFGARDEITLWDVYARGHLATLQGHKGPIFSVAFSLDGNTLASGAEDATVKLWEIATGKDIATLRHTSNVKSVAFSPDGAILATVESNQVKLWEVSTETNIATLEHTNDVHAVSYSPDGTMLGVASLDGIILWAASTKKRVVTLEHEGYIGAVTFSPDSKMLASANTDRFGGTDGAVKLWEVSTRENIATVGGHTERITTIALSPDGNTLAATLRDWTVRFWDTRTEQPASPERKTNAWSVAYSPDGTNRALGRSDGTVQLSDVKSGRRVAMLRGHGGGIVSLTYSPDGTMLAVGALGADEPSRGMVKVWTMPPNPWQVLRRQGLHEIEADTLMGASGIFSPDGKLVAVRSKDGVRLFDTETGTSVATLLESYSISVAFSPDGAMVAAGSEDGLMLWDISKENNTATLRKETELGAFSIAFSPDGRILVMGMHRTIELWDSSINRNITLRHGHGDAVFAVAFSPDGKTLVTGSRDGTALLWNTADLTQGQ
ncbi:MAG: hypothetical protein OXN17_04420 [Candidatus Poribacteria bacterium]|nr:hypothetical protein [Candidatus Poribacteria bacterium]MDE0505101.1 hypothetical protein [Candidatus Poribacteria bacterium]